MDGKLCPGIPPLKFSPPPPSFRESPPPFNPENFQTPRFRNFGLNLKPHYGGAAREM